MFVALTTADMKKQLEMLAARRLSAQQADDFSRAEALKQEITTLQTHLEKMEATGPGLF